MYYYKEDSSKRYTSICLRIMLLNKVFIKQAKIKEVCISIWLKPFISHFSINSLGKNRFNSSVMELIILHH